LTNCDREPIHALGAVQSFGFLVALATDWSVARASSNIAQFVGVSADQALGRPIVEIFSEEAVHLIRNMAFLLRSTDAVERRLNVALQAGGADFDLAIHFSGAMLVIEAEPADGDRTDASAQVRTMMTQVRQIPTAREFLQSGARQVRAVTGFDRVMVYRFDQSGSGEVVAESRATGIDSFLGLNYPASDIPAQARALYLRNVFRVITDVNATPVPIVPQFDAQGAPIDLSMSVLRAVSPIHLEYLRNMGVGASLSISIIVEGRLWGLFACHHHAPRRPNFAQRTAAELFGSMFSLMLESRERAAVSDYEGKARSVSDRLMAVLAQDAAQLADAEWLASIVADAIPCDGVGVHVDGKLSLSGSTPDEAEFQAIVAWLNRRGTREVYAVDHIAALIPEAAAYAARAAGMLAIPISRSPRDYVVLFRAERLRSVRWAGNPEKPVEYGPNGVRLTPRKSFEAWSELVKGRALPFTEPELRIAANVGSTLLEVVLRLSDAVGEERRKAEVRQDLLIAELNHRVRNILALIRGLIAQTRQGGANGPEMMQSLDERVRALARAHDQITADQWEPASLVTLIETEASAFLGDKRDRLDLRGDDVKLLPEAFTVIALIIHEMVTNAAKYGALSDSGRVRIDCTPTASGDVKLLWCETGGPPVTAPTRRGFGSTIIERSLPHELGGTARVQYRVSGLEAEFVIPGRYVVAADPIAVTAVKPQQDPVAPPLAPLAGLDVLLVEDSLIVALDCETALLDLGARDVLLAATTAAALETLAARRVDFAVLDLNLGRETSIPVADELQAAGTPFVFASGYGEAGALPTSHAGATIVGKPYTGDDLARAALAVLAKA
jgi:light-regulated signal transduction histidine kinase (bacteriophytochrome)/CheY-like chemotaxis protein